MSFRYDPSRREIVKIAQNEIREQFDLDSKFAGDKKQCLKAIAAELSRLKRERSAMARRGEDTIAIDAKLKLLNWGAWVLNRNHSQNHGWKPGGWLNGYDGKSAFRPHKYFI